MTNKEFVAVNGKKRDGPSSGFFGKAAFFLLGALLTGFLTVFFAKVPRLLHRQTLGGGLGSGLGVSLTLWVSQMLKQPPFILKGISPFIAGFCAALGCMCHAFGSTKGLNQGLS